mmetsp:Transcript_30918/g.52223  ORF Transcript_30918/g.52223 Transcript_30918/m.52223 type:complete len:261 (-) Transcript_30918:502-1284(-)
MLATIQRVPTAIASIVMSVGLHFQGHVRILLLKRLEAVSLFIQTIFLGAKTGVHHPELLAGILFLLGIDIEQHRHEVGGQAVAQDGLHEHPDGLQMDPSSVALGEGVLQPAHQIVLLGVRLGVQILQRLVTHFFLGQVLSDDDLVLAERLLVAVHDLAHQDHVEKAVIALPCDELGGVRHNATHLSHHSLGSLIRKRGAPQSCVLLEPLFLIGRGNSNEKSGEGLRLDRTILLVALIPFFDLRCNRLHCQRASTLLLDIL